MISEKIDTFLEVGRLLNFSEAAKKRYTTQPTISRQISDLENEWGMQLFVRSNKGLRLTAEGAIMLDCCRKINQQMETGLLKARSYLSSVKDKLRLGILSDINSEKLLMPGIQQFAQRYQDLEVSLSYGSFGDLRNGLRKSQLDMIFTYGFELENIKGEILTEEITQSHPCFAFSQSHPLNEKGELDIRDLSGETFYLPAEMDSPGREKDLLHILSVNKVESPVVRFAPNQESVLFQIRLGRGIMMVDQNSQQLQDYQLRTIEIRNFGHLGENRIMAVWERENLNPFLVLFIRTLKEQFRKTSGSHTKYV